MAISPIDRKFLIHSVVRQMERGAYARLLIDELWMIVAIDEHDDYVGYWEGDPDTLRKLDGGKVYEALGEMVDARLKEAGYGD